MQRRIHQSILATALVAFIAMPSVASDADASRTARPAAEQLPSAAAYDAAMATPRLPANTLLPDERDQPLQLLTLVGPALAIGVLSIVGLTITFRALRHDIRKRRIVYRPRRH